MAENLKTPPRPGDLLKVKIVGMDDKGAGLAVAGGFRISVPYTCPEELATVRVQKRKGKAVTARLESIDSASPRRVVARCSAFGRCGGCSLQHLPYELQLESKQAAVRQALTGIAGALERLEPILPAPSPWNYRNKMEFTFGTDAEGRLVCGLHEPGRWWTALPVDECHITPAPANALRNAVTAFGRVRGLSAWDPRAHRGLLRHLAFRYSRAEDAVLGLLSTGEADLPDFDDLVAEARAACPNLAGLHWYINDKSADTVDYSRKAGQWGADAIDERLDDLVFRISPASFFQTNPAAAVLLYRLVREYLELAPEHTLLDAFCGTGTIGLFCARDCAGVVGVELIEDAVRDARANAARNGIANATFYAGPARELLPALLAEHGRRFDRVVIDPPRGGVDRKSLQAVATAGAPRVVYVSCNPRVLPGDVQALLDAGYRIERVGAVDMFPQTAHVETAVALVRDGD